MTLVSVILPTYNRAGLLPRSIGSVTSQTFPDWELIVVDDRSNDNTAELLREFAERDSRIRRIPNTRAKGPSGARNEGLAAASGRYVAYLDSDDEWLPFHLERMVHYLETYGDKVDVMSANRMRRETGGDQPGRVHGLDLASIPGRKLEDGYVIDPDAVGDLQLRARAVTTQTIVGKSEWLKSVSWNEQLSAAEDCLYNLELCLNKPRVCHIQAVHALYWVHDDNLSNCSGRHGPARMEPVHRAFIKHLETVLQKHQLTPSQRSFVESRLARNWAWFLGYGCYEKLGRYNDARRCYWNAIKYRPLDFRFWKAIPTTFVKQAIAKLRRRNLQHSKTTCDEL
jgi:glycosyltransferase involved in cell wall biosynthesis